MALAGCGSQAILEPSSYYTPPDSNSGVAGLIKGTQTWGLFGPGPTVFAYAVDGKRVRNEYNNWSQLLPIKAGNVDLEVGLQLGTVRRTTHLNFKVTAGELYELRFMGDAPHGGPVKYCDIWVVALSSDTAITPYERITLTP